LGKNLEYLAEPALILSGCLKWARILINDYCSQQGYDWESALVQGKRLALIYSFSPAAPNWDRSHFNRHASTADGVCGFHSTCGTGEAGTWFKEADSYVDGYELIKQDACPIFPDFTSSQVSTWCRILSSINFS
jgi:hypothetical protein